MDQYQELLNKTFNINKNDRLKRTYTTSYGLTKIW